MKETFFLALELNAEASTTINRLQADQMLQVLSIKIREWIGPFIDSADYPAVEGVNCCYH